MKVILLEDVKNIGKKNQVVEVKDGYAKNLLFPKKLAIIANRNNLKTLEALKVKNVNEHNSELITLSLEKKEIEKLHLVFELNAHAGKAFGSISHKQILEKLKNDYDLELDKHQLNAPKTLLEGDHVVKVHLSKEVEADLKVTVKFKNV